MYMEQTTNAIGAQLTPVTENEQTLLTFIRNLHSDKIQREDEMTHKELFDMLSVLSPSDSKKIMGHYKNYRRTDKKSRPVGDIYVEIIRRLFIQSLWVFETDAPGEDTTIKRSRLTARHARFHREIAEMQTKLMKVEEGKGYITLADHRQELKEVEAHWKTEATEREKISYKDISMLKFHCEKAEKAQQQAEATRDYYKKECERMSKAL